MHRSLLASMLIALLGPGCGLTLDYDPPEDGGTDTLGMDAPRGGCGTCPSGTICVGEVCATSCTSTADCRDDSLCEMCDPTVGACVASTILCGDGCSGACDPVTDQCGANCGPGESCVAGSCMPGVACNTEADCDLSGSDCGYDCLENLCQERLAALCPDVAYECAFVDACAGCMPIPDPAGCPDGEFCDIRGGTFACVECLDDRQCVRAGTGAACVDNRCVECALDVHCTDSAARYCDGMTSQCVECLTNEECAGSEVCLLPEHQCGDCSANTDCPRGWRCSDGTCEMGCTSDGDCDTCLGSGTCTAGMCDYSGATPTGCDDGIACTQDRCAPGELRTGPLGCIHLPRDSDCPGDGIACTLDLCVRRRGCVSIPIDARCGGDPNGCIEQLCVPETRTSTSAREACVGHYVGGCASDEICGTEGLCVRARPCTTTEACDDGDACNGVEECVGGACTQTFPAMAGPDVCVGACDQYCVNPTSCAPLPGAAGCTGP